MKKELKIKDVMIGDWVDVRNDAVPNTPHLERITPSHFLRDEHWYGIELVPEILEKNGFVQCEPQGYDLYVKDKEGKGLYHILWQGESYNYDLEIAAYAYPFGEFNKRNIKYVHQLQHALRLCGIEEKIIL